MNFIICVTIVLIIVFFIAFIGYNEVVFVNKLKNMENDNSKILKILQEIACDYRVRIIRSGIGNVQTTEKCVYMGVKNNVNYPFKFDKLGKKYLINFRVFGKCYLACADSELVAWSIVISKAREESRNIFGRTGYLDKHKIQ